VTFSTPLTTPTAATSLTAGASVTSPAASSPSASPAPLSKWQKLFSAFKKTKTTTGVTSSAEAYRLKHSHNCSNSLLRAGISNMKGYKKANQDR
jgi:hypothetical protein